MKKHLDDNMNSQFIKISSNIYIYIYNYFYMLAWQWIFCFWYEKNRHILSVDTIYYCDEYISNYI